MLTLSKLAVRNEYCQEICDKGGLKFVLKCLDEKHLKNMTLLKSALSLLKSICNNDQVKHEATKSNAIELIKHVLQKYNANTQVCVESQIFIYSIILFSKIAFIFFKRFANQYVELCRRFCCVTLKRANSYSNRKFTFHLSNY